MPRGGGGASRGRGSGAGNVPRDVQVSKAMSWLLRHGAKQEGVKMDANGYVNVADLLGWRKVRALSVTFPELQQIVASNEKQRFAMVPLSSASSEPSASTDPPSDTTDDPSQHLIRATQGHSLAISSENLLKPILSTDQDFPALVVHGTNVEAWKGIKRTGGLKKMSRQHVHFARGIPGILQSSSTPPQIDSQDDVVVGDKGAEPTSTKNMEAKVISGMRANATIMVWVDVKRSMDEGGLKWWMSENGVVLTEGDEKGVVSMKWFDRVEVRGTGEVLWRKREDGES